MEQKILETYDSQNKVKDVRYKAMHQAYLNKSLNSRKIPKKAFLARGTAISGRVPTDFDIKLAKMYKSGKPLHYTNNKG